MINNKYSKTPINNSSPQQKVNLPSRPSVKTIDIKPTDKHARIIMSFENIYVDIPPNLKAECIENTNNHFQKLFAVLEQVEGKPPIEGRGIYHNIGGRFVYVKGTGNKDTLAKNNNSTAYAAFGQGENLFFDPISGNGSSHPRVNGTETVLWGGLEFVTATSIFAELVKQFQIDNLAAAREKGLTIPIGVSKFEVLSNKISQEIENFVKDNPLDPIAKQKARWHGNFMGLGAVALEVPSDSRMQSSPFLKELFSYSQSLNISNRTQPANIQTLVKTIKILLKHGYIYSYPSSHLQNIYIAPDSECAQADNSDILHLDLIPTDIIKEAKKKNISLEDLQIEMITKQLRRGFTYCDNLNFLESASDEDKNKLKSARKELIKHLTDIQEERKLEFMNHSIDSGFSYDVAKGFARILYGKFSSDHWKISAENFDKALISAGHIADIKSEYMERWRRFGKEAIKQIISSRTGN